MSAFIRSVLVFLCLVLCIDLIPGQGSPAKPRSHEQWAKDIARFEEKDRQSMPPRQAILFAGSSSMVYWDTKKSFPDLVTINRGFGGSHLSDSVYFASRVILKYEPKVVLVYAGDNDIAAGITPEKVSDDFRSLVKVIHDKLPQTRILFIAIKPSPKRWKQFDTQQQANRLIAEQCSKDKRLHFVDVVKPMLDDMGQPRKELYRSDGLHLSDKGYELWTSIVKPLLVSGR